MERSKYIICFLILSYLFAHSLHAQEKNYSLAIYNAYINGDMTGWKNVIDEFENKDLSTLGEKLELLNYYYGYIGYLIGNKKSKQSKDYVSKGEAMINQLIEEYPESATLNAYKGAFMGFKIALNKAKAITLGTQSMKYINRAYTLDPANIQALADKGNMLYYAPGMFGGDKKEAVLYYEKAAELMENNSQATNNWFYLNILTVLAQHYQELKDNTKAIHTYEKILEQEPEFKWVKDELYPNLLENM